MQDQLDKEIEELLKMAENKQKSLPKKQPKRKTKRNYLQAEVYQITQRFIKHFGFTKGKMKVPNYILSYLFYKFANTTVDRRVGGKTQSFFRFFSKEFESGRSGSTRYYLLNEGSIEIDRELKIEAGAYVERKKKILKAKQKSKV